MAKYKVFFYNNVTTRDQMAITVEASSVGDAYTKVLNWNNNVDVLNDEEENTVTTVKEGDVQSSAFSAMGYSSDITLVKEDTENLEYVIAHAMSSGNDVQAFEIAKAIRKAGLVR